MNVLITGGFGFLGGRLGRHLHGLGLNTYLATRYSKNKPKWLKNGGVLKVDWANTSALFNELPEIDILIHAAGTNASFSYDHPDLAKDFNGGVTAKLLLDSIANNVEQFIYLSTAHVYASPLQGVISEATKPFNEHPYATSHFQGEQHVLEASLLGKIDGKVLRLSNCFGAPDNKNSDCWNLLVNDICLQATKFNCINLKTSGIQSRDFIPVSELCRALEYLILGDHFNTNHTIFNIGGKSMSVMEMANIVRDTFYKKYQKTIEINAKNSLNQEKNNRFTYQMNWTKECNFQKELNFEKEIEDLLDFCNLHFKDIK